MVQEWVRDVRHWKELDRDTLYEIMKLRIDVFIVEQDCPYPDADYKDVDGYHVYTLNPDGQCVAYTRVLKPGVSYAEPSIGRVVTAKSNRQSGEGKAIMERSIKLCESLFPGQDIRISAQTYLRRFYEELGFTFTGKEYLEDGIPHMDMLRSAQLG